MKANFYARVTFQTVFSNKEPIYGVTELPSEPFGNHANTIILLGLTSEELVDIRPTALIVEKFTNDDMRKTERCITLTKSQQEEAYNVVINILKKEFDLDSSDDDQEMTIDTITEGLI